MLKPSLIAFLQTTSWVLNIVLQIVTSFKYSSKIDIYYKHVNRLKIVLVARLQSVL